ncbi:MAG: carbohydrate ABC transporter permease [Chloroflexota bacterium]
MARPYSLPAARRRPFWTTANKRALIGYLFVLPVVLVLLLLVAYPFFYAIWISFTNRTVAQVGHFVGFANYTYLFHWTSFLAAIRNTIILVGAAELTKLVVGMALALLLNENIRGRMFFRGLVLLPWAMPSFVAYITWKLLYSPIGGGFNLILQDLNPAAQPVNFLSSELALPSVLVATIWRGLPFWVIAFLAALQTVPEEYYDAAKTDGANAWHRFVNVTLPSIRHIVLLVTLLSTIWTANSFDNVWLMTQGGPSDATMIFSVLAYFGLTSFQLGQAAAVTVAPLPIFAMLIVIVAGLLQKE